MKYARIFGVLLWACAAGSCASARPPSARPAEPQGTNTKSREAQAEEGAEALRQRRLVSRVLRDFREALEGSTVRRVMETLDDSMAELPRFEDQLTALLRQTLERRVFFRESSWDIKGDRASVLVDAEMILTARSRARTEERRRERIQFDFVRTSKGWKIMEINPRSFFAP
jgi:hypothetical protein